jgi:hypothetical protein
MRQLHEINFFVWSASKLEFGGGVMCDSSLKIHYYTEDLSVPYRYSSSNSPPEIPKLESTYMLRVLKRVEQKGTRLNIKY